MAAISSMSPTSEWGFPKVSMKIALVFSLIAPSTSSLQKGSTKVVEIPKSAIVEKDFYVVPIEYLTGGGDSLNQGFNIEKTDENGNIHVEFQSHAVYRVTEDSFYIDAKVYNSGVQIIMPDSNEKFTLSKTEKLQGVYNINNGYAVFKQIEILSESNDYAIIADNTDFGVTIYDHIVLKGDSVAEKQIIFQ